MIIGLIEKGIDLVRELIPDGDERARLITHLESMRLEIAKAELSHPSLFVAGARPAFRWLAVAVIAHDFIVKPWATAAGYEMPPLATETLLAILGVYGVDTAGRSAEKVKGVARSSLKGFSLW